MKQLVLLFRLITTVRNWPVYFLNRFGLMEKKSEVRFKLWNGMTIIGRPFSIDRAIINEEWLDRCYEPNDAGIPWDWKSCNVIIDVGAHIGTFTLYAASQSPSAHILAYEPERSNFQVLQKNIEVNHLQHRVETIEAAVTDHDGTVTFHVTGSSGGHSMYAYTNKNTAVTVPAVSLSSVLEKFPTCNFLKLDCEGAEYAALYSLSTEHLRKIRFIAMEYHHFSKDPKHTPEQLKAFLEENGFTVMEPAKSLFFAYR